MGVYQSSGVRFSELDLSQVVSSASTTIGALVIAAKQGPVGTRQYFSDFNSFLKAYGNPDPTIGYGHYAAQAFLAQGNQLWVTRAIGAGYLYGGAAVGQATNSLGENYTTVNNYATDNPSAFNFSNTSLFPALSNPTSAATGTGSGTGGTLAAATYYVKIVAVDQYGNTTAASPESTGTTTTGTTSSIAYTWSAVSGAASYRIYYGTATGSENAYYTSSTNSFTLTATAGTAGTPPTTNTTNPISNYLYVYAVGPGGYAKNVSVGISSLNLEPPTGVYSTLPTKFTAVISTSVPSPVVTATSAVVVKGTISNVSNITIDNTTGAPTGTTATYDAGGTVTVGDKVVLYNMSVASANGAWTVTSSGDWTKIASSGVIFNTTAAPLTVYYQINAISNSWGVYAYTVDSSDPQNLVPGTSTVLLTAQSTATQNGLYTITSAGLLSLIPIDTTKTSTNNTILISSGHVFRFTWNGYAYIRDWNYLGVSTTNKIGATYLITAVNGAGESISSNTVVFTAQTGSDTSGSYSLLTDTISWPSVTAAVSYNIYQKVGSSGTLADYKFLSNTNLLTYTNYGSVPLSTAGSPPSVYAGTSTFALNVYDLTQNATTPVESWSVTLLPGVDGLGNQTEVSAVINDASIGSKYIRVNNLYANSNSSTVVPLVYSAGAVALSGGSSGTAVTSSDVINAWGLFTDKEQVQVTLLINGGFSTPDVQLKMDSIAQSRKDCMSILDLPTSYQSPAAALNYRNNILNLNSNYSALYGPDLLIADSFNSLQVYVPPSGHIAGQYAYNDNVANVWNAPAGLNRGIISNVLGARQLYNEGDRELLASAQINYVRKMPGIGYAIMEAWTLQSKRSALSFVPVRRMLITVETSLSKALLYTLWEPNDPILRMQIVTMISNYLQTIQSGRGLNKFLVVCDDSNNPSNDTANGILHVDVYMEPTLPVQQIAARAIITQQNASFSEAIAMANA